MLSLALVLIVGLGSVGLYLTAYVYPEIHRKTDIWWSGTGLFYTLILLMYRRPFGLLLGHTASVVLLGWLSYQALQRRWSMVEANPPQPQAGTRAAQAREVSDQVLAKIASVDWQELWERMGTQANDGTSEKSILPPAIKQRLDLSGLGEKLKGMISGKAVAEADAPSNPVQSTTVKTPEVKTPVVDLPVVPSTATTVDTTIQTAPAAEPPILVETKPDQSPTPVEPTVEATTIKAVDLPTPRTMIPPEGSAEPEGETTTTIQEEPAVTAQPPEQPEPQKAELKAELDQVISDLSPKIQDTPSNLPQPPDPLG